MSARSSVKNVPLPSAEQFVTNAVIEFHGRKFVACWLPRGLWAKLPEHYFLRDGEIILRIPAVMLVDRDDGYVEIFVFDVREMSTYIPLLVDLREVIDEFTILLRLFESNSNTSTKVLAEKTVSTPEETSGKNVVEFRRKSNVIDTLERLLRQARKGDLKAIAGVAIESDDFESFFDAVDTTGIRMTSLIGALYALLTKLTNERIEVVHD